jgi:hypothetical protein
MYRVLTTTQASLSVHALVSCRCLHPTCLPLFHYSYVSPPQCACVVSPLALTLLQEWLLVPYLLVNST